MHAYCEKKETVALMTINRSRLRKRKRQVLDEYRDINDDDDSDRSSPTKATKQDAERWLECIANLHIHNPSVNGVQMLLDAANVSYYYWVFGWN